MTLNGDGGETVGARIRRYRLARKMSQAALASELGMKGHRTIVRWEKDKNVPTPAYAVKLAEFFGTTAAEFTPGAVSPEDTQEARTRQQVLLEEVSSQGERHAAALAKTSKLAAKNWDDFREKLDRVEAKQDVLEGLLRHVVEVLQPPQDGQQRRRSGGRR